MTTVDAINQEVDYLKEQIDDRAGPKTLALLLCVSDDQVQRHVQDYIESSPGSKIVVESNRANYQTRIDTLSTSGTRRLIIVLSTNFNARLSIPSEFTSCEIICCNGSRAYLSEDSTYCGIRLGLWNTRHTYTSHHLLAHPYVYFQIVTPDLPEMPPPYQFAANRRASEVQRAARAIEFMLKEESNEQDTNFLAWLAGAAGIVTTGAALLITKLKIDVKGVYISCQVGMYSATVMPWSVSVSASTAVFGSLGAGIAVAAAVYFIPWNTLAMLMSKAWNHFVKLIGYLWKFIEGNMDLLARFIGTVAVVMHSIITGVMDEVTQCIIEFVSFVSINFPSIATMKKMLLESTMALGDSSSTSADPLLGTLRLASSLLW